MTTTKSAPSTDRPIDGRYTVLRHLADGGMGSVYVARDERLDRDVALKVMRPDLATDPLFVDRFRTEAQTAARLTDQHVVAVYDQGTDGDLVFLAMELVHGKTLRDRLNEVGALTANEALAVMDSVLAALAAAHTIGLVHRDVKPENVLIREDGLVKVADFGLARAISTRTATGTGLLGTYAYVAPEQVAHGTADARADVYSAALMLFELLTGRPAFEGDSPINVAFQHVHQQVPAPSTIDHELPAALDALVLAGAAADPDSRPADAGRYRALLADTRAELTPDQGARVPPAAVEHTPPAPREPSPQQHTSVLAQHTRVIPVPRDSPANPPTGAPTTSPSAGRRRRVVLAGVAATLLAGAAWLFLAGPGAARAVPQVSGTERTAAVASLAAAGFRTSITEAYSETVPAGDVMDTDPAANTLARALLPVEVTVSRGPERYSVPEVAGQDLAAASDAITSARLAVGARTEEFSESVAVGSVIRTDPPAGSALPPGGSVGIITSKGREPITIVDWSGKPLTQARAALEAKGITVSVSQEVFHASIASGSIISQTPGPTTLHKGEQVTFVVSKGPEMVRVPQVQGKPESEARALLEAAGFTVRVERIMGGIFGTARSTDPAADSSAPRGSRITLQIV